MINYTLRGKICLGQLQKRWKDSVLYYHNRWSSPNIWKGKGDYGSQFTISNNIVISHLLLCNLCSWWNTKYIDIESRLYSRILMTFLSFSGPEFTFPTHGLDTALVFI
jgi:hypothetical protein